MPRPPRAPPSTPPWPGSITITGGPIAVELVAASGGGGEGGGFAARAEATKTSASQRLSSTVRRDGADPFAIGLVVTLMGQAGRPSSITTRDLPGPNSPKRNAFTRAPVRGAAMRPTDGSI